MKKNILCIEDEPAIRQMIRFSLERSGYQVSEAENAQTARVMVANKLPDLLLVDWMLPDMAGPDLIQRFRQEELTREIPIIMLTARAEESDMVQGLDAGADDYLVKPVSLKQLDARIKALLRRSNGFGSDHILHYGAIQLDQATYQLRIHEQDVHIGMTEFRLLEFFMRHPNRVYSRTQLLDFVWGQASYIEERTVDVHILRLRKVLKKQNVDHYIRTVRGAGYLFSQEENNA